MTRASPRNMPFAHFVGRSVLRGSAVWQRCRGARERPHFLHLGSRRAASAEPPFIKGECNSGRRASVGLAPLNPHRRARWNPSERNGIDTDRRL